MRLGSGGPRSDRVPRSLRTLPVVVVLALVSMAPVLGSPRVACAGTEPHAALVVDTGARELELCVALPSGTTSGIGLIQLASTQYGLDYRLGFAGKAACRLAGVGTDGGDCFGDYPNFWGYWRGNGNGSWTWSSSGAADTVVHPGNVEGWSWGSGQDGSTHPPPPPATLSDVCGSPAPSPTPTPSPKPTPSPRPTPPHPHRSSGGGHGGHGGDAGAAGGNRPAQGDGGGSGQKPGNRATDPSSPGAKPSPDRSGGNSRPKGSDRPPSPTVGAPIPATGVRSGPVSVRTLAQGGPPSSAGSPGIAVAVALLVASFGGIGWILVRRRIREGG